MRFRVLLALAAGLVVAADEAPDKVQTEQAPAIAAVKQLGGSVEVRPADLDESVVVAVPFLDLPASFFGGLLDEPVVASVNFFGARLTDADLEKLAGLIEIRQAPGPVRARGSGVGELGRFSAALGRLILRPALQELYRASLREVYLTNTQVTDAGLAHLKRFTNLRALGLSGTAVTGAGLAHLKEMANLQSLGLACPRLTDAGLGYLKGLTNLRDLSLAGAGISDGGLAHLKGLARLDTLSLTGTRVTDAGLKHLRGLSRLHRLYVGGTRVSDQGVADLQKALPEVVIVR
jgi:hypothetical protein